ncbi:MAG: DUF167 domain-containing protein [Treponema sp.]|jgi:uncharacterized protein (TIGR00251 family)|nr:DUF167 domain-containing protein [Treponema sp.]
METCIRVSGDSLLVDLKVQPGASKSCLAGVKDRRLKVRIAAAPEGGKANAEIVSFFAGLLGCPKRDLTIKTGEKSRLKTLALPLSCRETLETAIINTSA